MNLIHYCFSYSFRKLIKLCKLYHTNVLASTNRLFHTGIQNTPLSKNIILHFLSSSRCLHSNTLLFRSLKYLLQHFNNKVGSRSLIGPQYLLLSQKKSKQECLRIRPENRGLMSQETWHDKDPSMVNLTLKIILSFLFQHLFKSYLSLYDLLYINPLFLLSLNLVKTFYIYLLNPFSKSEDASKNLDIEYCFRNNSRLI